MQGSELSEKKKDIGPAIEKIVRALSLPAKLVGLVAKLVLTMVIVGLLVGCLSFIVLTWDAEWGFWGWLVPCLVCGIPVLVGGVFWYALSTLAEVPDTLRTLKGRIKEGMYENIQRAIKKQNDGKRKTVASSLRLVWHVFMGMGEVQDVMFTGTIITFLISPIGWAVSLALAAWLLLGSILMFGISIYYLVT